jgi:hypothetical protein
VSLIRFAELVVREFELRVSSRNPPHYIARCTGLHGRLGRLSRRVRRGQRQPTIHFEESQRNRFKHANFGQPGRIASVGSTSFGVITNTRFPTGDSGSSRQVQLAAEFLF